MLSTYLFKNVSNIKFIEKRWFAFFITFIFVVGSLIIFDIYGLNLGIDFTGGTVIEVKLMPNTSIASVRYVLRSTNIQNVNLQMLKKSNDLLIRVGNNLNLTKINTVQLIKKSLHGMVKEYRKMETIGPIIGSEMTHHAIFAMLFGLLGIFMYVWFRFDWHYALCAVFALIHDVIATIGLFAITRMEFNLTVIAALLTIAGYSINDTVVIFDRVRENRRKYNHMPIIELYNLSINETLSRTLMTSLVTLLAVLGLIIFGGPVIHGFSIAMAFGICVGTYSSVAVALSMLLYLDKNNVNE